MAENIRQKLRYDLATKMNIFFVADVIFLAVGISSFVVGVWLYIDRNIFVELTPSSYSALSAAGLCCFTGATVSIISIVGLAGAWMHNKCLLLTFIGFVVLLGIVQSLTGLVGLFHKDEARDHVRLDLLHNINKTHVLTRTGRAIELSITWNQLQQSLKCCGVDGPEDWFNSRKWPQNNFVPDSCCDPDFFRDVDSMEHCGKTPQNDSHWYQQGCYPVFIDWLFHHIRVVNWLSIILLLTEVGVIPPALILLREVQDIQRKGNKKHERDIRRRLVEINERERNELQLYPLDRVGDANVNPEQETNVEKPGNGA